MAHGVRRGHRVAIVLPQRRFETAVAHIAIQQIGAVAVPLSLLFGAEALEYRLRDSGAVMAIVAREALPALRQAKPRCEALRRVIVVGSVVPTSRPRLRRGRLDRRPAGRRARFKPTETPGRRPGLALHQRHHRQPQGRLDPAAGAGGQSAGLHRQPELVWFRPADDDKPSDAVFWSPADWAWTGGLMDALLPTLYFGGPSWPGPGALPAGQGLRADGASRRHAHLPLPDRAQGHDEGRPGRSATDCACKA